MAVTNHYNRRKLLLDGRWSIKGEYLYVDFGSEKFAVPINNTSAF
jgi:hypothetical protein